MRAEETKEKRIKILEREIARLRELVATYEKNDEDALAFTTHLKNYEKHFKEEQFGLLFKIQGYEKEIAALKEGLETQTKLLQSLSAPPLLRATIENVFPEYVDISLENSRERVAFHSSLKGKLKRGKVAYINSLNHAIISIGDLEKEGTTAVVSEVLENGRVRLNIEGTPVIVKSYEKVKKGDNVVLDTSNSFVVDNLGRKSKRFDLETITEIPWDRIGGLNNVIEEIRESVEQPLIYPEIYRKYSKKTPKGIFLYGPPGCGKTLLAKSLAYNLAKSLEQIRGKKTEGHFLSIKGPEILVKWVGDSEEMIRNIFSAAREKVEDTNDPVIIFIDEADAILKRRGSGISTDIYDSIVPQFLSEMDGMQENKNIIVVLATNREDMIDPAVIRPGRVDKKFKIPRPDEKGTAEIYQIYLWGLPFNKNIAAEIEKYLPDCDSVEESLAYLSSNKIFSDNREVGMITLANNLVIPITYRNLVSGALIEHSIDRAKNYAIQREIKEKKEGGIQLSDIVNAIEGEFTEACDSNLPSLLTRHDLEEITNGRGNQVVDIQKYNTGRR